MNSEKISPATLVHFKFSRQAILERNCALWGSEIQVHAAPHPNDNADEHRNQLLWAYGEALQYVKSSATPVKGKFLHADVHPGLHKIFRMEQFALMDEAILDNIISASSALEKSQQQLIISVENSLDTLPGPSERRAMIRQLYSLKDRSGIKLAYNNYRLDTKQIDLLIDLNLYDYIKMPFPDTALRLSLNTRSGLFDRLYDDMLALISATKVSFIADNVEHAESAVLASRLPFDYFQGHYYSPADNL